MTSPPPLGNYFEWVVHLTRGELLDLVLDIESRLRRLVRAVLVEANVDWESKIPQSIRSDIEGAGPPAQGSGDILDRANLGQLIGIVLARWKLFSELLGDKPSFQVKANEFRKWRNALAHGANPSPDEKVEIAVLIKQVGQQIPVPAGPGLPSHATSVVGSTVVWVDDNPEWNLAERQILRALAINVLPVLTNDEAIAVVNKLPVALVISDIDHGDDEPGDTLPGRLSALGLEVPIVFYVDALDPDRGPPPGATSIQSEPALLVRDVLNVLSMSG